MSWNLDPQLLADELAAADAAGRLPAAVVAVDLYGQCADYDAIVPLCAQYGVPLVEDAAEALGSSHRGRAAGTLGDIGILSFNGNKIITTSGRRRAAVTGPRGGRPRAIPGDTGRASRRCTTSTPTSASTTA